ncbi:hypothetical protein IC63_06020 [Paracoccus sphaerophysae]|uniref:Uncharacterized protein n=1 Tax=Paracoccus sphaerophysae TaxID=690417 RepID=A0A099FC42_9RHOB|nr:hypothetical protein IC63_06020 [Paracoccus sphaerophysae]
MRCLDLGTCYCLSSDGAIELWRVGSMRRENLDRLEAVAKRHWFGGHQHIDHVSVARKAGHFGAVAMMVVRAPSRNDGRCVFWCQDFLKKRMSIRHASVEDADRRRTRIWSHCALLEVAHPIGLLDWSEIVHEECSSFLSSS